MIGANINEEGIVNLSTDLQTIYGNSLKIVLESCNKCAGTFLENTIVNRNGKLEIRDNNKSMSNYVKTDSFRRRFPDISAMWPKYVYVGTMYSQLLGMDRRGTSSSDKFIDGLWLIKEWMSKGYNSKWIIEAVCRCCSENTDAWVKCIRENSWKYS